jgi:hypothetical protein
MPEAYLVSYFLIFDVVNYDFNYVLSIERSGINYSWYGICYHSLSIFCYCNKISYTSL